MYQSILVAVDGSDEAMAAADDAVALAGELGASVHALYVVEKHPTYTKKGAGILAQEREIEEEHDYAEQVVAEVVDAAESAGISCETHVTTGQPAFVIAEQADKLEVDAIVLGIRGRSGLKARVVGSTTERVLRQSPVTVIAVR